MVITNHRGSEGFWARKISDPDVEEPLWIAQDGNERLGDGPGAQTDLDYWLFKFGK